VRGRPTCPYSVLWSKVNRFILSKKRPTSHLGLSQPFYQTIQTSHGVHHSILVIGDFYVIQTSKKIRYGLFCTNNLSYSLNMSYIVGYLNFISLSNHSKQSFSPFFTIHPNLAIGNRQFLCNSKFKPVKVMLPIHLYQ
jgi:hypothetical protein